MSRATRRLLGGVTVAVLVASAVLASPASADSNNNNARKLTNAVTLAGVLRHLVASRRSRTSATATGPPACRATSAAPTTWRC